MTTDSVHVTYALIQKEIESHLAGNNNLIFEFHDHNNSIKLDVITVNAQHSQAFLFHSTEANSKLAALNQMLDYVKVYKDRESSFTIQWTPKGNSELHTSYFRAPSIIDALNKLYYGRDEKSIVVFSAVLNPIS